MKHVYIIIISILILHHSAFAQQSKDSISATPKKEKQIKGWSFGAVPAIAFDSDIGFKYGAIVNLFDYGDGSIYPDYRHNIYLEWSRTTKGSGINEINYDTKSLIPGIRLTSDLSYLQEQALDFYGFNGYEANYNHVYENNDKANASYLSRMFYRIQRNQLRFTVDLQSMETKKKLHWIAGYALFDNKISDVNIADLNKDRAANDLLPAVSDTTSLYTQYKKLGIIPIDQQNGGTTQLIKLGLVYDTRDNEPNPMKGMWTEALIQMAPSFIGNKYSFTQLCVTHRQYFTLINKIMNFAYRVSYQGKLSGDIPFYMLPLLFSSNRPPRDGLGGAKTLRGILRNRVVGDGMVYGNFEVRWKFLRTIIWGQNVYLALTGFTDVGRVVQKYKFNMDNVPKDFISDQETFHVSYGSGMQIVLNANFIVNFSYALAREAQDGSSGFYINLNYLF